VGISLNGGTGPYKAIFCRIFPYIALNNRLDIYGRSSNKSVPEMAVEQSNLRYPVIISPHDIPYTSIYLLYPMMSPFFFRISLERHLHGVLEGPPEEVPCFGSAQKSHLRMCLDHLIKKRLL